MKKFSKKLSNLIDFINFTHEFRTVIRVARIPNDSRMENDAEHSYQLAMVAWFLIDQDKLRLNKELCFMYAMAHDLVEVYAGDTMAYDKNKLKTKHKREAEAFKKIKKRFNNFKNLLKIIENYEKKSDKESKFIYALDKILPPIQCLLEDGKLWHEYEISFEQMCNSKKDKVILSKDVSIYWEELLKELTKNKTKYFPK